MEQTEGKLSLLLGYPTVTMLQRILLILLLVYTTQVAGQNVIPEFQAYGDGKKSDGEYCCQIFVKNVLQLSSSSHKNNVTVSCVESDFPNDSAVY